jgi:hypothetical protein
MNGQFLKINLITAKLSAIAPKVLKNATVEHIHSCTDSDGEHFEHFLGIVTFTTIRNQQLLISDVYCKCITSVAGKSYTPNVFIVEYNVSIKL